VPVAGTGQVPLTVSFNSEVLGYVANPNLNYAADSEAGFDGLRFQQVRNFSTPPDDPTFGQVITIVFSRPVTDLVLPFGNISLPIGNFYADKIIVMTPGYTYSTGAGIIGDGTSAEPFRNSVASDERTGPDLMATVEFAGPVSAVSVRFYDGLASAVSGQQQAIILDDMTFVASCPPA